MIYSGLLKKFFILFFLVFTFCIWKSGAEEKSVITIESADTTDYKKNKETGDDEIILSGGVKLSIDKGSTHTAITADSVTYSRKTSMIFARGNISLKQKDSNGTEQDITASTLLINTSTLEGVFDNGRAVQSKTNAINLPSGSTLIVGSDMFGRSSQNTIAFNNANLTFCDSEDPHWKIKASKIWLLPGGEFAFFNALLFVGHVPILYLPAFYYPKDEMIFNPSFGYSKRTGYFVQTTTYLLGRKPLEDTSSDSSDASDGEELVKGIFNFMKASTLKDQVREGLVLHNLESDYSGDTSNYLKIMGDFYSNIGYMAGVKGVYSPKNQYISDIEGDIRLGFSDTVFLTNSGAYTNYASDGMMYTDSSSFMGLELPFRFGGEVKFSIAKPFKYSLSLPIYSDPYFNVDFGSRTESLDWISFALAGSGEKEDLNDTSGQISSFTWTGSGSYTFDVPFWIKPYITNLSISNFSSSIIFNSKSTVFSSEDKQIAGGEWAGRTPERSFYYPSQVTPIKASGKIAGSIFKYPRTSYSASSSSKNLNFPVELVKPDFLFTEDEIQKKQEQLEKEEKERQLALAKESGEEISETGEIKENNEEIEPVYVFTESDFPLLSPSVSSSSSSVLSTGLTYSLDYSLSPQYTTQLNYDQNILSSGSDFDWNNLYSSYYQLRAPVNLSSNFSYNNSMLTLKNSFDFDPVYQDHPNLDGYTSESSKQSVIKSDYTARKLDLNNSNEISLKPFYGNDLYGDSSIVWSSKINVIKTEFLGDVENPEWDYIFADLTDETCFPSHTLSGVVALKESSDFSQKLTISSNLPPQLNLYTANLAITFPYLNLSFQTGLEQKSKDDDKMYWQKFQQSATFKLADTGLTFTESMNYEIEEDYFDSFKLSLAYNNLSVAYTMMYTTGYDIEAGSSSTPPSITPSTEKEFIPYDLSFNYTTKTKTYYYWKNRISVAPALSTSLVFDYVKLISSYFRFVPSLSFKFHNQMELTFSSESRNDVIFRYFQHLVGYEGLVGGETDVFKDLVDSFSFWDTSAREQSGFKLKNLKMTLTRKLCDWDLSGSITFKPRLEGSGADRYYNFDPYIAILVSWKPMPSMKTSIVDDYGEWKLNPK